LRRLLLLVPLAGCTFPSDLPFRTLDYVIEGPRVVALRTLPTLPMAGDTLTVDALALAPDPIESLQVDVCGVQEQMAAGIGTDCYANPDLVEPIGTTLPLEWQLPAFATPKSLCEAGGGDCDTDFPLRLTVTTASAVGRGVTPVEVLFAPRVEENEDGEEEEFVPFGVPTVTLEPLDPPVAGGLVEFMATTDVGWTTDFRWFVDAGELIETGRTAKQDTDDATSWSGNALVIPEDFHGPLRVSVVVAQYRDRNDQPMAWTTITLEVP